MSQSFQETILSGKKTNFQFNEDYIKNYNEEDDEVYFLELDVKYLGKLHVLRNDL